MCAIRAPRGAMCAKHARNRWRGPVRFAWMPILCLLAALVFQPGFHQALRVSVSRSGTTQLKVPIGRAGARVRLSFRAGDGSLALHSASVAHAGSSDAVAVTFNGAAGF